MTSHPRDFTRDIVEAIDACADAVRPCASAGAVWVGAGAEEDGARVYAGVVSGTDRMDQGGAAGDFACRRILLLAFRGRRRRILSQTMDLLGAVEYDCVFGFKYSARPNTPALAMIDSIPEAEKAARLQVLLDRQREIQRVNYSKHIGQTVEVMVEGMNPARGQVSGRSSQNKPVNFTCGQPIAPAPGSYVQVRITAAFPNSLVGESRQ